MKSLPGRNDAWISVQNTVICVEYSLMDKRLSTNLAKIF